MSPVSLLLRLVLVRFLKFQYKRNIYKIYKTEYERTYRRY